VDKAKLLAVQTRELRNFAEVPRENRPQIHDPLAVLLDGKRIDYRADAVLVEGAQARLGIKVKELEGTAIPVRFTGRLDDPTIRLDVDEVLRGAARHEIERKVEEKLKGEWGDKLKRFFGR
jgi:hypothetical protein